MGRQISEVLLANAASACIGKRRVSVVTGKKTRKRNGILHPKNKNILLAIGLWLHDTGKLHNTGECFGLISSKPV